MRVLRNKFTEGEKVLCYEPDPAKTKVLYDSKVLDIVSRKDENGKKVLEFLIHFQGWNSTWDRFVTEEYVLKDTEENRKLQRELAEKAQLTAGCGNLYRKHIKKRTSGSATRNKDWSSRLSASGGADSGSGSRGSSGVPAEGTSGAAVASAQNRKASGNDEKSDDDWPRFVINFVITPRMRTFLESDYSRIKQENRVVRLPCSPTAVEILQLWMTEYIYSRIRLMCYKKGQLKPVPPNKTSNVTIKNVLTHANLCHEVADGLRVYMDFMLKTVLLYDEERTQYRCFIPSDEFKIKIEDEKMEVDEIKQIDEKVNDNPGLSSKDKLSIKHVKDKQHKESNWEKSKESPVKEKVSKEVKELIRNRLRDLPKEKVKEEKKDNDQYEVCNSLRDDYDRRKSLRPRQQTGEAVTSPLPPPKQSHPPMSSQKAVMIEKRAILRGKIRCSGNRNSQPGAIDISELLGPAANKGPEPLLLRPMAKKDREFLKKISERKLLPETYCEERKPSFLYGAVHLARSLLKMPELLSTAEYDDAKVNLLIEFLKNFMQFLEDHPEWFSDDVYVPNTFGIDLLPMHDDQVKKLKLTTIPSKSSGHKSSHPQQSPSLSCQAQSHEKKEISV